MREKTGYKGNAIVDPSNQLAAELRSRGLLNIAITEKKGYEYGMAQPGFLVISKGEVWEKWEIVPSIVRVL
jgi:hypothetical protein